MRLIAAIMLLVLVPISFLAQELSTEVERNPMLIGEINHLIIEHQGALKQSDLLEFKFLDAKSTQTTEKAKAIEVEVYGLEYTPEIIKIQFTVWDSALVVLPPFALSKSNAFTSQAVLFQVNFPETQNNNEIADIYQITIESNALSIFWTSLWLIYWLVLLLLFAIGFWLVLRIKEEITEKVVEIYIAPNEKALQDLENLMLKRFFNEEQKLHFAEFSDIMRTYIGEHFGFVTLEKTTQEISDKLRLLNVEKQIIMEFSALLQLSDMIKFSKATTDEIEIQRAYNSARELIVETTKTREDKKLEANSQKPEAESQSPNNEKGDEHGVS
jgi:hypothetical protein